MAKQEHVDWHNRIVGHGVKPASQFIVNERNWRTHPQSQRDALHGALNEVGWVAPVVENVRTGRLVDGHERIAQALQNGDAEVPYVEVELDEAEEAYVLATLDPIGAMAQASKEKLNALLDEVRSGEAGVQAMLAEVAKEAGLFKEPKEAPEPQVDKAEELREKWQTERGQVWEIGKHRLMCGDSTSKEDVERLMVGERARITLTDPPYNVGIDYGDQQTDTKTDYLEFNRAWFSACPSGAVVLTPGIVNLAMWYREIGAPKWLCSWRKVNQCSNSGLGGFNTWEPLLVYGKVGKHVGHDSWDIPVAQADVAHPVPKTVEAWSAFMESFSEFGALVYDPFLGSGTTMVAAEQLGRICYGMEIEPKYVAVTLQRMADMGLEPRLIE